VYWRKQYETGLLVLAPLLQRKDLEAYLLQEVVGLSVDASLQAGWFEKALQYLEMVPVCPPAAESDQPGLTKLQGDLFLKLGDFAAARACYEQEIHSGSFVRRFLGLFSSAWSWLLEDHREEAFPLIEQALAAWFELDNESGHSYVFDNEPVCIGRVHIGDDGPGLCVKQVCEFLLQKEADLAPKLRGQLSYLLYLYFVGYYENRLKPVWEQKEEHEQLLVQAAQLFDHPLLSKDLYYVYQDKGDLPMAVEYHLRWCIQSLARDSDGFDVDDAEFATESEEAMSQQVRQRIHEKAWTLLQAHQTTSIVEAVFLPF
jgi:tetratricopeptide (TPR) repeat protein